MVTIVTDLKIGTDINSLSYKTKKNNELKKLFTKFEFTSLMGELEEESEKQIDLKEIEITQMGMVANEIEGLAAIEFIDLDVSSLISLADSDDVFELDFCSDDLTDC